MTLRKQKSKSSVFKTLWESPGSFAFSQAVKIVKGELQQRGVYKTEQALRFRVNPNLSFPPGDIEDIGFYEKDGLAHAVMTMNLMGLHGAGSPLPSYFTEYIAQHQDEPDSLRVLMDLFNHKLINILYHIWRKYRYFEQYETGATDRLSRRFFGVIGMGYDELRMAKQINWEKLFAYMGLIAFKSDAAGSLESILRHYFSLSTVYVQSCIHRTVDIPKDQQCRLGVANFKLNSSFVLGEQVSDQTGKFRVQVTHLTWTRFTSFLPDTLKFREFATLVKSILRSRLEFDLELKLLQEEIRPFQLAEESGTRLGWSTWLGDNGDGRVVLEATERNIHYA
jgi:type VI secretion system protein ImpH